MQDKSKTKARLIVENKELLDRVEVLEKELQDTHRAATLGRLTGGVAHDFNNLLQAIQGNVSLMLSDIDVLIERQVRSGARMAGKLLEFSSGDDHPRGGQDLNEAVEEIVEIFGRARKQVSIYLDMGTESGFFVADKGAIEHVLLDLFLCAANTMQRGGHLYVRTSWISCNDVPDGCNCMGKEGCTVFLLSDCQEGVGEQVIHSVLQSGDDTCDVGIELIPAQRIVTDLGGILGSFSDLDGGRTFFFTIPSTQDLGESSDGGSSGEQHSSIQPQILIVDDEEVVLDVGSRSLEHLGYRVISANSGPQAIEVFQKEWRSIDLVILDIVMPEMNGREVFARLKKIDPEVKVLLASGYLAGSEVEKILDGGGCGFIKKPFSLGDLEQKVEDILARSR